VKRHGWPDIDPADLAKLRKIAVIRENPYASLYRQIILSHNQRALEDTLIAPIFPVPSTAAEEFDSKIKAAVYTAHFTIALTNSKKLETRKQIARCAQELANVLRTLKKDEKDILVHFLPHRRQATFDDFVTATRELAAEARHICSLAGRPSGRFRQVTQRSFVTLILDAAADAHGPVSLAARNAQRSAAAARQRKMLNLLKKKEPLIPTSLLKALAANLATAAR
jgi:hypothetical protein